MNDKTPPSINALFNPNQFDVKTQEDKHIETYFKEAYSKKNIGMKTDLNMRQIIAHSKGRIFTKHFKCQLMGQLCNHIEILSVSKNRQGRKEWIELTRQVQNDMQQFSLTDRLFGAK